MADTLTLTEFLLARIAEDAEDSDRILYDNGGMNFEPYAARVLAECEAKRRIVAEHRVALRLDHVRVIGNPAGYEDQPVEDHCVVCDPESDDSNGPCPTLRALAGIYVDHPDYREDWRA